MKQKQEKIKETMKELRDDIIDEIVEKGECDLGIGKFYTTKPFKTTATKGYNGGFEHGGMVEKTRVVFRQSEYFKQLLRKAKRNKKKKK